MRLSEIEIERLARTMIVRYGSGAAREAVARLNKTIDRGDWDGRERWACVLRAIHADLGDGPAYAVIGSPIDGSSLRAAAAAAHRL
jgi:hypothetical protein